MLIPALVIELDEAHVALGEAPGQQAVGGVGPRLARLLTVELEDAVGLGLQVHRVRHRRLHAIGHLVLGDARVDLGIHDLRVLALLERPQRVEHPPAAGPIDAGGIVQEEHRILAAAELHALVL